MSEQVAAFSKYHPQGLEHALDVDNSYLIRIYFAASFLGKTHHGRAGNRATLELKLRSCYVFPAGEFNIAQAILCEG